ncbi:hypothetical protein [Novosphingobium sp.]|uniref:tetratricopeptide repeat protein n=1 Tax=Novosphingobium sp. TaxID=1874826 RepID=UPI0038B7894D
MADFAFAIHDKVPLADTKDNPERKLRSWRAGKAVPDLIQIVKNMCFHFFEGDENLAAWEAEFVEAYNRERYQPPPSLPPIEPSISASIPNLAPFFMGRADELAAVLALFRPSPDSAAILIQGSPGMGKTELTKAVALDRGLVDRFGKRRWFVPLETAKTTSEMEKAIILAIGCDPRIEFAAAMDSLRGKQTLLILDNLETPWEQIKEQDGTEKVLAELGAVAGVSLLASFRGFDLVGGPLWQRYPVNGFASAESRKLFAAIAGEWVLNEANLDDFVVALGGIPLAIDLVARRASGRSSLSPLWREWNKIGTDFADRNRRDGTKDHLTSLSQSIRLSLNSPRVTDNEDAVRLFSLLGCLPAGVADVDRDTLIGEKAYEAEECLLVTGLAIERMNRIDMLPPIRDFAIRHRPPGKLDGAAWPMHYVELARNAGDSFFRHGGADARKRLPPEFPNIEAALKHAQRSSAIRSVAVASVDALQAVMSATGVGEMAMLQSLADACRDAGDSRGEAATCVKIGIIGLERGHLDVGWQALEQGLAAYHRVGNVDNANIGIADCLYRMADIKLYRSKLSEAKVLYIEALSKYEAENYFHGMGDSIFRLADIAWCQMEFETAKKQTLRALEYFGKANYLLGEANCVCHLARVALDSGKFNESSELFNQAILKFTEVKYNLGVGHCAKGHADINFSIGNIEESRGQYKNAMEIYRDVGEDRGIAYCHLGLAKIDHLSGDANSARKRCNSALQVFAKLNVPNGVALAYEHLAEMEDGLNREVYIDKACKAWSEADLEVHVLRLKNANNRKE